MTELGVSDIPAAVDWWSDVLGRPPSLRDEKNGFALFEVDGGRLAVKRSVTPGGGTVHFEVDELPAGELKVSAEGYRRVKLTDPDGNVLVLFEWIPANPGSDAGGA